MGKRQALQPQTGIGTPDLFIPTAREKEDIKVLQERVRRLIRACYPDTTLLIREIESRGLPVITHGPEIQLKLAMMLVGARPGFISPELPKYNEFVEALKRYMPHLNNVDFSRGMLLTLKNLDHITFLTFHFYHWTVYRAGQGGYDYRAQQLFDLFNNKYQGQLSPKFLEKLDSAETLKLKLAIRREREALQFIRQVINEIFIPANNGKLLEEGRAQA